jgi:hypothetical protein
MLENSSNLVRINYPAPHDLSSLSEIWNNKLLYDIWLEGDEGKILC